MGEMSLSPSIGTLGHRGISLDQRNDMSVGQRMEPITAEDFYRMIRGQIEHEDNLIAQRLSWFVAAQSFLFSGYAISLNAPVQGAFPRFSEQTRLLNVMIPLVAIGSCVAIYVTIWAGVIALRNLRRRLAAEVPGAAIAHFPPVQGATLTRRMGLAAPLGLPPLFGVVWLVLLIHFWPTL
jgi:hypothetical protein